MTEPRPTTAETELIERIRSIDVRAPESLHRQVESMIADRASRERSRSRSRATAPTPTRLVGLGPRLAAGGAIAAVADRAGDRHRLQRRLIRRSACATRRR